MDDIQDISKLWHSYVDRNEGYKPYPVDQQIQRLAALFAPAEYYYYILNFYDLSINYVQPSVKKVFGIAPEDFTMENLLKVVSPDDLASVYKKEELIIKFLDKVKVTDIPFYKFSYFFKVKDTSGKYHQILHQATAMTTSDNTLGHVLGVHIDVSHWNIQDDNKMNIIGLRDDLKSHYNVNPELPVPDPESSENEISLSEILSGREIEIIFCIAQGLNTKEIAKELNISEHTINTHRKNILNKTASKNTADLVSRCLLEGVI